MKNIIIKTLELIFTVTGAGTFVACALDYHVNEQGAGLGAAMMALGVVIGSWGRSAGKESITESKEKSNTIRSIVPVLILIGIFTFWTINLASAKRNANEIEEVDKKVNRVESDLEDLQRNVRYNRY